MSRAKLKFAVGDQIRIRQGVRDPDFPDIPIGGWAGTVEKIYNESPPNYLIRWNTLTLESIHPIYKKRCERDGLDYEAMALSEHDLEPETGKPLDIEQPTSIQTKSLDMAREDDRIRSVFGLTSDDPVPDVDFDTLHTYRDYLAENLSFPLEAERRRKSGRFSRRAQRVNVVGLGDPEEDFRIDETHGLICEIQGEGKRGDAPLAELDITRKSNAWQLVNDYQYWFSNWG